MINLKGFPRSTILVLFIGLTSITAITLLSFSPIFYPIRYIDNTEKVKELIDIYLSRLSPELRVKEIMEFSNHYYIMIEERDTKINAFELLLDKSTGRIFYEPGPNMMWNTKYGHMGRVRNPTATMPVTRDEASRYAQSWLDRNIPGAKVEEPETFYGYYTIDISKEGRIFGMLSVNGYTGEVWYHSWHGKFIRMVEYE